MSSRSCRSWKIYKMVLRSALVCVVVVASLSVSSSDTASTAKTFGLHFGLLGPLRQT